ncbi:MAG: hypothetical protein COW72_02655 [Candidatus Nealsonbacteria bacterium CG18_big_fil_WC_8_21_14_2_50_37_10]|uniref:SpoVT-AbrB domain-containing protein n=1 Tax=Candidatus Nealsonbacteria bacterium CG18_big_fil_WC_8_21_14_2_50_37_10 TaxID=1974717 RepID=A0A2H0FGA5_9BACT|nr:MAG: hypothetical protein COW72_02655 [Candidatus Nealsonbacteria bacterium CG18_big_fil_WC_8_21_14_2_50_37_10]
MIKIKKGEIKLNSKGRFLLPKEERAVFWGKVIVITREDCFLFLTEEEWNRNVQKRLTVLKGKELRKMRRALGSSAFLQKIDSQGMVLIPKLLRKEVEMKRIELLEVLDELDPVDETKDSQSRGGGEGAKRYPAGEFCTVCNHPLPQLDPRDTCFRCQARGIMGNPRKPIDKNKKGQKGGER